MDAQVSKLRVTRCCWRCYSPCRRSSSGLTPPASTSDEDGDGEADEMVGHGTHVAEIVKLTAPKAGIIPRAQRAQLGRPGQRVFVLAEAIQFASRNGAGSRYPAAEDGALTVTLVDQERKKSSFANYGGWVDVA